MSPAPYWGRRMPLRGSSLLLCLLIYILFLFLRSIIIVKTLLKFQLPARSLHAWLF